MAVLAHFSDIHVTLSPLIEGPGPLLGKRMMGTLNYYVGGRRQHFAGVEQRIERLLEDIDAQGVDHALCTGDLTAMSYPEEFERCAKLFGPRIGKPERWTVLPGNHDRYTDDSARERSYEHWFAPLAEGAKFPFRKQLAEKLVLVALDVSRPSWLLDSSGFCGEPQLAAARALLADPALSDSFVILGLHYGLLRDTGRPDRLRHGLVDYRRVLELLDLPELRVDLVLHGHIHRPYLLRTLRVPIGCAGSATDLHQTRCGYDLYRIDVARRTFEVTRRIWDASAGRYGPEPP